MIQNRKRKRSRPASTLGRPAPARDLHPIALPKPTLSHGKPLMKTLRRRRTTREISRKKLPLRILSNLLWAAWGVNRKRGPFGNPGRTAASASNSQEIDLYIAMQEGVYLYDAFHHRLVPVVADDLRALAIGRGQADSVAEAPVQLVYVVDVHRLTHTSGFREPGLLDPEIQRSYYYVDTGLIAGNVYLFAASQGLAAWFHNCNRLALAARLKLRADQYVLFGQTVGYPASSS
jgi:nitroreductase